MTDITIPKVSLEGNDAFETQSNVYPTWHVRDFKADFGR
jgi:hypothetical protein